jgi:hypothetical protein
MMTLDVPPIWGASRLYGSIRLRVDPRKWSNRTRIIVAVVVVVIIAAGASSSSKKGSSKTTASSTSAASRASDDAQAQAIIARALKVVASDREDFHTYSLVSAVTLKNLDHSLKPVSSLDCWTPTVPATCSLSRFARRAGRRSPSVGLVSR